MTDLSAKDLAALSVAATAGEWEHTVRTSKVFELAVTEIRIAGRDFAPCMPGLQSHPVGDEDATAEIKANAAFICALVNLYRSGKLVHVDRLRDLVKMWREEARLLEGSSDTWCRSAKAIGYLCADELVAIIGEKSE